MNVESDGVALGAGWTERVSPMDGAGMIKPNLLAEQQLSERADASRTQWKRRRPPNAGSPERLDQPTVLHLIDSYGPGGAETIYCDLVSGLDRERWRSIAAVPQAGWLFDSLCARGATPRVVPTTGSFDIRFLRRLDALLTAERVDLVHAHLVTSGLYGGLAGRLRGVPVICTLHGQTDFGPSVRWGTSKMRLLGKFATRIVAVSESLRRLALATGVEASRLEVIYNGIDTEMFAPGSVRSLRGELGIDDDEVLIGAVGNVRRSKDYAVLLKAAARLRSDSTRYRFVIAGRATGPLFDDLIRTRRELGLENVVTFAGFREDIAHLMQNLDVFVTTSSSEGFSLTTVQAMACGVPVVATRSGGPEEIVEDGVTGLLVPTGSPDAVAGAIHALVAAPERRARLARAGRAAVQDRFRTAAMLDAYQALYQDCLARGRRWHRS